MLTPKLPFVSWFGPWRAASQPIHHFLASKGDDRWRSSKLSELTVVIITGALIAGVVSSAFSWPTINDAPWTAKALLYSALILSLTSISIGTQQSIALYRIGGHEDGLETLQALLKSPRGKNASKLQLYIWQVPVMMLNIAILVFLIGLMVLIWARAAEQPSWDQDMRIAFVATLAGLFALINYIIGTFALYNINISQPTGNKKSPHDTNPNCESGQAGLTCSSNSNK